MNLSVARWRKSSHSGSETDCVEVAIAATSVAVRDTKQRDGGTLLLPAHAWTALLTSVPWPEPAARP